MIYSSKPLAITMGDPSGIGPEIVAKSLSRQPDDLHTVVFGDAAVMKRAVKIANVDMSVRSVQSIGDARFAPNTIEVLQCCALDTLPQFGDVSSASGKAAYDAIVKAVACAMQNEVSGIVTAPIHKSALSAAGIKYPSHTEILAALSGAERVAMLLGNDVIRTVLVTIHVSLFDAIQKATFEAQMSAIRLAHQGAIALGFETPRVAVAGLNPHAGESGLFGREEFEIIAPAIKAVCNEGINASGPWPGDTVFMRARQGEFDIVVAQYHDQGLIPVKYLGLENGVNITLGLPFVRTSPDHGTAFDIAGQGIAVSTSLETAITYANQLIASKLKEAL
ncbi:4-hydroxythreonine-4-phosphate dehydrogenase PdxA [Epibacterium ulvae]|uniref:4-hydroxythreonine-4-phosphate dehydrogenase PdxA n=1 Tax=Epibacterium ulvae TaxID=1156985 RepID=UPI002493C625|nr:4-hydroxythreonine-4-phosphate dehydrogenase PdxA [Epibacterium ulvae]